MSLWYFSVVRIRICSLGNSVSQSRINTMYRLTISITCEKNKMTYCQESFLGFGESLCARTISDGYYTAAVHCSAVKMQQLVIAFHFQHIQYWSKQTITGMELECSPNHFACKSCFTVDRWSFQLFLLRIFYVMWYVWECNHTWLHVCLSVVCVSVRVCVCPRVWKTTCMSLYGDEWMTLSSSRKEKTSPRHTASCQER